jgi:hypothetical protein
VGSSPTKGSNLNIKTFCFAGGSVKQKKSKI